MEFFVTITFVLLIAGVVGSLVPMIPGAFISLIGVTYYWWSTGFSQPHILLVLLLYMTGLTALLFDWFAGALGSKAAGASDSTVRAAALAGILFFFIGGPIGTFVGIAGVVYVREYLLKGDKEKSMKAALYTAGSMLGSTLVQGFLTGVMLIILALSVAI